MGRVARLSAAAFGNAARTIATLARGADPPRRSADEAGWLPPEAYADAALYDALDPANPVYWDWDLDADGASGCDDDSTSSNHLPPRLQAC